METRLFFFIILVVFSFPALVPCSGRGSSPRRQQGSDMQEGYFPSISLPHSGLRMPSRTGRHPRTRTERAKDFIDRLFYSSRLRRGQRCPAVLVEETPDATPIILDKCLRRSTLVNHRPSVSQLDSFPT